MKLGVTMCAVALMFCLAPITGAAPPAHSAKFQLPEQASDQAKENRANKLLETFPPPPVPPVPPVIVPTIISSFTSGQTTSTAEQQRAAQAVAEATQTIKTKIANSTSISIITIIGRRDLLAKTKLPPTGRSGDLETTHWRLSDRQGRRIGDGNALCRWATVGRRLCWGELRLPRGRLIILGSSQTRLLGEYAVVGGTGVYAFKQGIMSVRILSTAKFVFRILLG